MIPILIQMNLPETCWKEEEVPCCILHSPLQYSDSQRFLQRVSAKAASASITTLMESTFECSEESGWTTILCDSLSQSNDGGDGSNSHVDDTEDDDSGDFGVDDEDDGSSSLASDACSHAYRDMESCFSHSGHSNAYGDIGVQETDGVATGGGLWYGYNDEGGGYGGGGRNYSLCCESKVGREKDSGASVKPEQEKKIFAAKSELQMQANAAKELN
ncbi:uncharacterized protein LOC116259640 isoform X2 [Nymphaea colorata]|uniref:uncharacterized protein LOC116259640 isoform X2 n=1 Tax=Nymphaea colorata TaxID=210225 RepID=UPI00214EA7A4|nr:uncharacterized protein LOC116259640 isoform X2 [Nymphaea colorata]